MDPLGHRHQLPKTPNKRYQIDRCADYVMDAEKKSFKRKPSANHIYFDAYSVIHGTEEAYKMLRKLDK